MLRSFSIVAVLAAFAVPAFAAETTTTSTTTTTASTTTNACNAIVTACKTAGFTEGNPGKDLYKDCVDSIAAGKAVTNVTFKGDAATCKAERDAAAKATTTPAAATAALTEEEAPATTAPSAGTSSSSSTTYSSTTTTK